MKTSKPINPLEYLALLCSLNKDKPTCKETLLGRMEETYQVYVDNRRFRTITDNLIKKGIIVKAYDCFTFPHIAPVEELLDMLGLPGKIVCPTPVKESLRIRILNKILCRK